MRYIILLLAVAKAFSLVVKTRRLIFSQGIGDSASFDFERVANKGWYQYNDQIIMAVLQETRTGKGTLLLLLAVWYPQVNQQ